MATVHEALHGISHNDALMNEWRATVKLIPILAACLLAQGCVGIFVGRTRTETFKKPGIGEKPGLSAVWNRPSGTEKPTANWLQEHWGKPASVRPVPAETQGELWTYKFDLVWYGVIPCVGVPVPLVLPLGREKAVFFVREGHIVSVDVVSSDYSGAGIGLLGPDGRPWAGAKW